MTVELHTNDINSHYQPTDNIDSLSGKRQMKSTFSLASLFGLRMLGLFMILPIFALYANQLHGATTLWVGLTLGVYGATSCLFQLIFGWASDHFGRKKIIALGLLIFAIGSLIAGLSDSIYGVFIGRALQGAGAIGSATLALIADLTKDKHRTKAMATVGMTIGFSFVIAMVLGPLLVGHIGLSGLFYLTGALALIAIIVLYKVVPSPKRSITHEGNTARWSQFKTVMTSPQLLNLDLGIFTLHAVLTASFMFIPLDMLHQLSLDAHEQWMVYLPVFIVSVIFMVPFVIIAEKKRHMKGVLLGMIALMLISQIGVWLFDSNLPGIIISLMLFFTAFTVLEALLPSWISKVSPVAAKGTAMGIYSSSQYLGAFIGGSIAGLLLSWHNSTALMIIILVALAVWWILSFLQAKPPHYSSRLIHVGALNAQQAATLQATLAKRPGVVEVMVAKEEGTAYLKVIADLYQDNDNQAQATET
ncbi:MFS transporter [Piscirickettsia salmonis]|uniref:MFS transporter n=1 Tax=Piscirickettsia salmonis TaxID=1238 RepID=UPI0002E2BB79|nr:MFS transporter [Piscirickettsia salmonis]APS57535.1 sugar (and other) transporter family protein [Piscirickettsia salmonis]ERL61530.1 sugar (and other) transporter family protein [Piscirickettsia salmonis LF-89 = ATCC VR-1361]PEQ15560.1 MFS transporter [Piscirickettsia salmonis]QGN78968.1 Inner membrane transport protein YajR [Piscirickettsia salmonis]QGN82552.1 Inner membrane transport protein YajR [Piscirickettsia salmonis]